MPTLYMQRQLLLSNFAELAAVVMYHRSLKVERNDFGSPKEDG